jgi:hypothetical protein
MRQKVFAILFFLILTISLVGCNLPTDRPATDVATATSDRPTQPPADVQPTSPPTEPPTATQELALPTETPTVELDTPTPVTPSPIPPTPTRALAPTSAQIIPVAGARFDGSFDNGRLTFRIGPNSYSVVLKTVILKQAVCNEGSKASETLTFDAPTYFQIVDSKFAIYIGDQVTISGAFTSPTRATGTIRIKLTKGGGTCTIGPTGWVATAQ